MTDARADRPVLPSIMTGPWKYEVCSSELFKVSQPLNYRCVQQVKYVRPNLHVGMYRVINDFHAFLSFSHARRERIVDIVKGNSRITLHDFAIAKLSSIGICLECHRWYDSVRRQLQG